MLIRFLTSESNNVINWLSEIKIIVNPDKLKPIAVQKNQVLNQPIHFIIGKNKIDIESFVNLLGISIDNQLNFKQYISNLYKSASNHLNVFGAENNSRV